MRQHMMRKMLGILAIMVFAFAVPLARAEEAPHGTVGDGNRIVFTSGHLTGEFEGNTPHLKFYASNMMGRSEYIVNFRALIEFYDSSGDGAFQSAEELARATLDSASWTHTDFYAVKDQNSVTIGVGFNLTLNSPIQIEVRTGGPKTLQPGNVVLVVKAYNSTRTLDINGRNVTINTAEIKIDVVIINWPFEPQASHPTKLALQVNMKSNYNHFDLQENTGSHDVDASHPENTSTDEHEFHHTSDAEQEVRYASGVLTTSSDLGFFRFVDKATVTPSSGQAYQVDITASYKGEQDTDHGGIESFLKLYLAYPYFQGTIVHDPSIGLAAGGFPTLYLVAGGGAVAALGAVVAIRRKHPSLNHETEPIRKD